MDLSLLCPTSTQPLLSSFSNPFPRSRPYKPLKLRCSVSGGSVTADCVIVGGGISGKFIAQTLVTKHPDAAKNVIVTEAKDRVCNNNKAESTSSSILLLFDLSRFRSDPPTASSQSVSFSSSVSYRIKAKRLNKSAYVHIDVFGEMEIHGVEVNEMIMVDLLVGVGDSGDGFNVILATSLVDMYGKCGELGTARYLFDEMPKRSLVSWNSTITGYNQSGEAEEAMRMFLDMLALGFSPDRS
ncbi:FAD/NAD(P)-binding domain protein [Raphanus sativus]|nr:FAD/NAD(P)-binding domain protein [Raphanus sativus]